MNTKKLGSNIYCSKKTKLKIMNLFYLETILRSLDYVILCTFSMNCHSLCMNVCLQFEKYRMLVSVDPLLLSFSTDFK